MRTTIDLPDELFREAKAAAAKAGSTLTAFIGAALRQALTEPTQRRRYRIVPHRSGGLRPGVHLDRNVELREVADPAERYL